jgi:hypothetical protein
MDITRAKEYLLRTHLAGLVTGERPGAIVMESPPGIGKTEAEFQYCEQLCLAINQPVGLVQFMLATITSPDVRGFMIPTKNPAGGIPLTVFSQPPWFPARMNVFVVAPTNNPLDPVQWYSEGEWEGELPEVGVVFLDEWGQADEDVKKPAAELLLNGNVGTWRLPKTWRVSAATNRVTDRSGVMRELMFVVNRRSLVKVEPRLDPWLGWVETQREHKRPHYLTVSFARSHPGVVFRETVPDGSDPFCTPRSLVRMDKDLRAIRSDEDRIANKMPDMDTDPLALEVAAGCIGSGSAGQYMAHLKYADQLPDVDDIINDPEGAKLPRGQDGQMVCAYMLVEHIGEDTAGPFLKYISRMHKDMGIMAVTTINADPKRARFVYPTPEYREYQRKNKNVLIAANG